MDEAIEKGKREELVMPNIEAAMDKLKKERGVFLLVPEAMLIDIPNIQGVELQVFKDKILNVASFDALFYRCLGCLRKVKILWLFQNFPP